MPLSANQIDKLGWRLAKSPSPSPQDLDLLDEYERSFEDALASVVAAISQAVGLSPTTRPMKTVRSIQAKVRRDHTALSRMQDVAGCRLVVEDVMEQDEIVDRLQRLPWERCQVVDRRQNPSHGYRAVHLVVRVEGRLIEIQVRSRPQDLWAQLSEKIADRVGLDVKYGGGPSTIRQALDVLSAQVSQAERLQLTIEEARPDRGLSAELDLEMEALEDDVRDINAKLVEQMHSFIAMFQA